MRRRGVVLGGLAIPALAQERSVRMVLPFPPGGANDIFARRLASRMQPALGMPVLVENRPGDVGAVGTLEVVNARPDGLTILFATVSVLALNPLIAAQPRFDPMRDLVPVSLVGAATIVFAARPDVATDLAGLVAAARARPGALRYGSTGTGSQPHLAMELLKREIGGLDMPHVSFGGGALALAALREGRIDALADTLVTTLPFHRSGTVRALAVAGAERSRLTPHVPTVAEALGLPGFEAALWLAVMLPAGVLESMRDRLAYAIHSALAGRELRAELLEAGFEPGGLLSPPEITAFMVAQQERWRSLLRELGLLRR